MFRTSIVGLQAIALACTACSTATNTPCRAGPIPTPDQFVVLPDSTPVGTVSGYLQSLPDGGPLPSALGRADSLHAAMVDSTGHFVLTDLRPGASVLDFLMVGYFRAKVPINLPDSHGVIVRGALGRNCALVVSTQ